MPHNKRGKGMLKFRCMPIAAALPMVFIGFGITHATMGWVYGIIEEYPGMLELEIFFTLLSFSVAVATAFPAIRRVEVYADRIVCKGLFPKDTFTLAYDKCSVGMDYHIQYGRKVWWIYFCHGPLVQYKANKPMNSVKIQPGFIKIMYSREVFTQLIEILPKKQKTALVTANRCSGLTGIWD